MKYRLVLILLSIVLPLMAFSYIVTFTPPIHAAQTSPITAQLAQTLQEAEPTAMVRVMVYFKDTANLNTAQALPLQERRAAVVNQLQSTANASQAQTLNQLEHLQNSHQVHSFRQLWIINAISLIGTPPAIQQIAANPQIETIDIDHVQHSFSQEFADFNIESFALASIAPTTTIKSWGISHMGAPSAWHGLNADGSGVVVAVVDSGVDFTHPDLLPNYRGNLGNGTFDHSGSWYYADDPTVAVPTDTIGHGTHVAGIAIGQNGIGVAPGAEWMAVGISDEFGYIYDSNSQAGLQWLLAPNGDPSLAPDVINGSWSDRENGTALVDAVEAIVAAGIVPVFAVGNYGPTHSTIGSPASYTDTLAIGAHDLDNELAWFSARGPTPFYNGIRPQLVAPGTNIFSTYLDGNYASTSGTSMAAPHAAGAVALLLSADDSLNRATVFETLKNTAVPLTNDTPNMDSGWGAIDAYAAVAQHAPHGTLRGTVTANNAPLANIPVIIQTNSGYSLQFETNASGVYEAHLSPGTYTVTVSYFGYNTISFSNVVVSLNQTKQRNVALTRAAGSQLNGVVTSANAPLADVVVSVIGSEQINAVTDANGRYQLYLPEGQHKLAFWKVGYEYGRKTIYSQAGPAQTANISLPTIPKLLLIDAGQWHYGSQISYYESSLRDINQTFDTYAIKNPNSDVPSINLLAEYDTVIWSDPSYSPGILGASGLITDYLETGGNMVLSGQNIGNFDSSGYGDEWWYGYLQARFLGQRVITQPIAGAEGTDFSGLVVGLNGPGSAVNQFAVDGAEARNNSLATPLLYYADGSPAALGIGQCEPYKLVYFGFGLEGVTFSVIRSFMMDRLFDYLETPDQLAGTRWLNEDHFDFGVPGQEYTYTLTVQNISEIYTDTISIDLQGAEWPTSVMTSTMTLGPCETGQTILSVTVPDDTQKDSEHAMRITAVSQLNPAQSQHIDFDHKTPGNILIVDDDRWYDQEIIFQKALASMDLPFDTWDTNRDLGHANTPSLDFLLNYDFIIWYTGYDWFQPITPDERDAITAYLDQGGRLFLSSQDFMYYHNQTDLAQTYFGAIGYQESVSPTAMFGGGIPGYSAELAGPLSLEYGNYLNFSDGLQLDDSSEVLFWHNAGLPAAIGHQGESHRAVFMGVPFETLPASVHNEVMNHMVGWISDLGDSGIVVDNRAALPSQPRVYTITIQNATIAPANWVTMTNVLPDGLTINPASLTGGATYDAASGTVRWQGELASGESKQIVYLATPDGGLGSGTAVQNSATFAYARHLVQFDSYATMWINPPDLRQSTVTMALNRPIVPDRITFTLWITNSGLAATDGVTAVLYLPDRINPVTSTLSAPFGTPYYEEGIFGWAGDLAPNQSISTSLAFTRTVGSITHHIQTAVAFQDGVTGAIMSPFEAFIHPYRSFFTIAGKAEE